MEFNHVQRTHYVGRPLVSPRWGLLVVLNLGVPQLPLWATFCRASGTFSNIELVHYEQRSAVLWGGRKEKGAVPTKSGWPLRRFQFDPRGSRL